MHMMLCSHCKSALPSTSHVCKYCNKPIRMFSNSAMMTGELPLGSTSSQSAPITQPIQGLGFPSATRSAGTTGNLQRISMPAVPTPQLEEQMTRPLSAIQTKPNSQIPSPSFQAQAMSWKGPVKQGSIVQAEQHVSLLSRLQVRSLGPSVDLQDEPFSLPAPLHRPSSLQGKRGMYLSTLIVALFLIVCVVGTVALTVQDHGSGAPLAVTGPMLTMNGPMLPGETGVVHGHNFLPGGKVSLLVDGTPPLLAYHYGKPLAEYRLHATAIVRSDATDGRVVVKRDGTFDETLTFPKSWQRGSRHTLRASVQQGQRTASSQLDFTMLPVGETPSSPLLQRAAEAPSVTPTATSEVQPLVTDNSLISAPTTAPTVTPCLATSVRQLSFTGVAGQSDPGAQPLTLKNCGGPGLWSASVMTNDGANWLHLATTTGPLDDGSAQIISVSASNQAPNLSVGTYTGQLTFTMRSAITKVAVTLVVTAQPPCLKTDAQSLAFQGTAKQADPANQTLTLTNCGATGNWSAAVATDDGANWLGVSAASGSLNAGASQSIAVGAASGKANLGPGTYTGHLTFTSGSSVAKVDVTLTVVGSSCVQTSTQALTFTGKAGPTNPAAQAVTLTNCGAKGSVAASVATDSGGNWLSAALSSDALDAGATSQLTVASVASIPCGTYTGHVTVTIRTDTGTTTAVVNVTLTLACS